MDVPKITKIKVPIPLSLPPSIYRKKQEHIILLANVALAGWPAQRGLLIKCVAL